ncbi:7230_t:CDS:2 [Funneliformis geosporum]|nr:7230_t:CDS:2 [Funneliformis geosporum]
MSNEKQNFLLYQLSPLRKLEEVNLKERGKKEKYIEDIFVKNLENFFPNLVFLKSQCYLKHPTEERDCIIDTLAFNKSNNSFLIIEYKREKTVELFYQVREYMECLEEENQKPLKALIFDLLYNRYYGVIIYVRIFEGELTKGQKIKFYTNQQKVYQAERVGVKIPKEILKNKLVAGEIDHHISPLAGYQEIKPNVYSNLYPSESSQFKEFKKYLEELQVQDSSLSLESVDSQLLGSGFRCGFLGLLHREIICERLQKEYNCEIITTPPSITYRVVFNNGEILETSNPQKISAKGKIKSIEELLVNLEITTPEEHLGDILQICQNKRGICQSQA